MNQMQTRDEVQALRREAVRLYRLARLYPSGSTLLPSSFITAARILEEDAQVLEVGLAVIEKASA